MTEKQAAWLIEKYMRENGADKIAFDLIVGSGPNGALPHAIPGERKLQSGEPIIVDIGCRIDHYHSDLTRTICLGQPADDQFMKVYKTVLKAQETAEKKIKAGRQRQARRTRSRGTSSKKRLRRPFGHGLGHGVGLGGARRVRARAN